ncbi:hypothetical protein Cva_00998 [Caedimonas varicaedens]|uniref:Uncharacterized protein n=1 Tax=Caedimonas varicaedens TaxID=1629334 RepID=A0A0K8MCU8_9PROT|nr:hypothetical protein Cva_00998 [Caedimonas varicaedens]
MLGGETCGVTGTFLKIFLKRHHSLVLLMTTHKIKAFFIYPPQECCQGQCPCHMSRRRIVLSLNLNLYHQEKKKWLKKGKAINGSSLHEIAHLLGIPDENGLLEEWKEGIPLGSLRKTSTINTDNRILKEQAL